LFFLAFAVLDLMASLECERKKGRWRNHRTPGKSSDQERQEQEKGRGRRAVEEPPHSREVIRPRKARTGKRKRKKGGGGTTALQGSHQTKKGKKNTKGGGGDTVLQGSHQNKKAKRAA
jgi:hypothetical protein